MYQTRQEMIQKLLSNPNSGDSSSSTTASSTSSNPDRSLIRQRQWNDAEQLIDDNLREVNEKLPLLEKQIWGKLVVMESNRRTAKAYLRHPVITIDGSDTEFDGTRIGLSRFENLNRLSVVYDIFNEILQGIKIKIDPDGSIWAKRMCSCPVFLKPLYISRPADLFDVDKRPVKVFDIRRFKEILVHELSQPRPNRRKLEKCCMVCLELSYHQDNLMRTPCWILIIHLVAIELLNLVLPKDNEMSSPSSSFTTTPPLSDSPGSNGFPAPPPPLAQQQPNFDRLPSRGPLGRNSRSSGVFRRIQRKEAFENNQSMVPFNYFARSSSGRFGSQPNSFGTPYNVSNEFDRRRLPLSSGQRPCSSMLDLRQVHHNPLQMVSDAPMDFRSKLRMRQSSVDCDLNERSFSVERMDGQRMAGCFSNQNILPPSIPREHFLSAKDRLAVKKWRSQDSGIASGSGSYGRQ